MQATIKVFQMTYQSYRIIEGAIKAIPRMGRHHTMVAYIHLPNRGWWISNLRNGESISLQDFQASGSQIITDLPQVSSEESYPSDAEQLFDWFSQLHQDYLKHLTVKRTRQHKHEVGLVLSDSSDDKQLILAPYCEA